MELRITTKMDPGVLPEIEWNNEELKREIALKAEEYRNLAYTDEQSAEMKKDRATLNKLVTAFEDQRRQIKRFYQAPYDKFEVQVKEVLAPVKESIETIDAGLAEIERKYREDKKTKMQEYYNKHVGDLKDLVPFARTIKEEYFKRAFTEKKLEQVYLDLFARIKEDISNIEDLDSAYKDKILLEYAKSLSLVDALREGKRLEKMEASLIERRRKQEEESAVRESAERQAEQQTQNTVDVRQEEELHQGPVKEEDPVMSLDFRAWGTKAQLMGLRQYMIDNNIKFGKVE